MKIIFFYALLFFSPVITTFASDKLDPFSAEFKTVIKTIEPNPAKNQKKESKDEEHFLRGIRVSSRNDVTDRLVFDLNITTPYDISYLPEKGEVEIKWKVPIKVSNNVLEIKAINTRLIQGLYWKKDENNVMSCIVELKKKNLRILSRSLHDPARVYIDVMIESNKKSTSKVNLTPVKAPEIEKPFDDKKQDLIKSLLQPEKTFISSSTSSAVFIKEAPIAEKIAYNNAKKIFNAKDYQNALQAYEEVIRRFPETVYKEDILFAIADSYYNLAEKNDPTYYKNAINSYKKAILSFPKSIYSSWATYQIAESQRKSKYFSEAKSQYLYFIEKYPDDKLVSEARFWNAECLYQMNKIAEALKEFERFIDDYKSGAHIKEAMFRLAECYYKLNDFDRSEYYFEKALKKWPDIINLPVDTLNNMSMTYYYKGKFNKSRDTLFLSFNLYPSQTNRESLLRIIGDSYQWGGEMQKALSIYGLLISLFPDTQESIIASMRMADLGVNIAGLKTEDFSFKNFNPYLEPEKTYRWVIENDKTGDLLTEAFYKLGFILAKKEQYAEAVSFFKLAMNRREKGLYYKKSIENIKMILVKTINRASIKEDYFSVLELYQKNKDPFLKTFQDCSFAYNVGFAYLELGFVSSAEKIFNNILKNGDSSDCRKNATICLSRIDLINGETEKAEERLSVLLFGSGGGPPVSVEAYHFLGDAYFKNKKYKEAVAAYSVALINKVESFRYVKSLYRLGESFGRAGYYYNGITTLKKFVFIADRIDNHKTELKAFKEEAEMLIGDYFFIKQNYVAAINAYRALSESTLNDEKKGWAIFKWADALMKSGDVEKASTKFAQIANDMPYNILGRVARSKIDEIELVKTIEPGLKQFL